MFSLLIFAAAAFAAPQGINNANVPGTAVPPVSHSGDVYPTVTVLGPISSLVPASADRTGTVGSYTLVPNQEADPTLGLILDFENTENPQPIRGQDGTTDPGPRKREIERQRSDLFARPGTDSGDVANAVWPMGLSSNRPGSGENSGWARQQNIEELPIATEMAGVDMRLAPNAYRELHWHSAGEWSYIITGTCRITAVNQDGQTYVDDLQAGDLWFFPPGVPHSIQASEEGVEFLLIFDQGSFSEDNTDLVTEMFLLNPREVLAKNFQTDVSDFDNIPKEQKYIFNGTPMQALDQVRANATGPAGEVPLNESYTYHFSLQEPMTVPGGQVKLVDSSVFPIASNFSAGLFSVEPGAMREIHWHLTSDEWNFILEGQARLTSFQAPSASRTFDLRAGDVGYIPVENSHYLENTGNTTLVYLEVLQAPLYQDMSVAQWLGLTPPQIVRETLQLPQSLLDKLPKTKPYILPGNTNYSTTNFTVDSYPDARTKRSVREPYGMTRNARIK